MDADMHIASYSQLQLIQRQHLHRMQQQATQPPPQPRSLLLSPSNMNPWRSVGAPAHGTVGTFADLAATAALPNAASLSQRVGGRTDPLFNPQNTSNVYINGLPTFFTTQQLYDLCSEFGTIASVRTFDRLNTPEPSTYGFVLFAEVESARRCIIALRQYSDLHPSFAKTQKIPQPSTDAQLSEAFEKRMERLSLFDSSNRFLAANSPQSIASRNAPIAPPALAEVEDPAWRARVVSAPVILHQGGPNGARPKFANGRSPLETVLEDPTITPEAQADLFIQGLPLQIQRPELDALFAPHKILDDRVCQVLGVDGMPDSISGVMRMQSMSAAREIQSRLQGLRLPGWAYDLKIMVIENQNEEDNDNAFEVQPGRTPVTTGKWSGVGLGVPPIRSTTQAVPERRISSMPTGSSPGIGTMASIHAPHSAQGVSVRKSSAIEVRAPAPIYTTGIGAVGSERSSPIGAERHAAPLPPLQLDPAFSPRSPTGSGSDGSMSPVSPALTFTSSGRTPTMATIATPRHDDESKNLRGEGAKETGLDLKLGVEEDGDGEVTARAVGLAGLDE